MMKQFGDYSWHVGGQALFKHPAFDVGIRPIDQLYYTVLERGIGLFGFNFMNVGLTFDYFKGGIQGNSYYAPGLVFGYSPPLGDIMDSGFSYRLQYRIGFDGTPTGLRHIVSVNFAPNVIPVMPLAVNTGIEVQQGQPLTFFFSTGVGFSPTISLQKGEKPAAATPEQATQEEPSPRKELLKALAVPQLAPADPTSPGTSPVDSGSTTGREVNVILR